MIQRPYVLDDESEEDDPPQVRRDEAYPPPLSGSSAIAPESSTSVLEIVETNFDEETNTKSVVQEPHIMAKSSGVKVETDSDVKVST